MTRTRSGIRGPGRTAGIAAALCIGGPAVGRAQEAPSLPYASMGASELYGEACAGCHGIDGTGRPPSHVAFEEALPDFSDCTFASREPDADWVAVAHEGGPVRGFSEMMPAFGGVLDPELLGRAMEHIRTFCGDDAWPRGELNLPRPLVTEKAYPEDEAVLTSGLALDGPGSLSNELTYEKRFGARSQIEVSVPFGLADISTVEGTTDWEGGLGDIALGFKHALFHSFESGSIFSLAAELKLPTGKEDRGFGKGEAVFEPFVAFGQILPGDAFFHVQGILEFPLGATAENEGALRLALGRTFTEGPWGRAWSPMVELLAARELESGATTHWDIVPQMQVTLNTRQHVMLNAGVRLPINDTASREPQLLVYLLWDWFDGPFFDGW